MAKICYNRFFPNLKRVCQKTPSHCGPAVLEMLLSHCGIAVDQEEFVKAAGVAKKIKERGMTVDELALAVKKLVSGFQFWFKRYATISELAKITRSYHYPVGVEWQGIFEFKHDDEDDDEDPGHYSVVTYINTKDNLIMLADPYRDYAFKDRQFTILEFERRWWDINEIIDPRTKKHRQVDDYHLMFVVTPQSAAFPRVLGMKKG